MFPQIINCIQTTHHDKIDDTKISLESTNGTDRHRRLIPYMTFYLTRNYNQPPAPQYQLVPQKIQVQPIYYQPKYQDPHPQVQRQKINYTPFLDTNKVPGQFTPMVRPQSTPQYHTINEPNFSAIFDKLLQMKQTQTIKPVQYAPTPTPQYQPAKLNIAAQYYTRRPIKIIPIPDYGQQDLEDNYKTPIQNQQDYKTVLLSEIPNQNYKPVIVTDNQNFKPVLVTDSQNFKPILVPNNQNYKPILLAENPRYKPIQVTIKPTVATYKTIPEPPSYKPAQIAESYRPQSFKPSVQIPESYPVTTPKSVPSHINTIIHTYTPSNIEIPDKNQHYDNFESLKVYTPQKVKNVQIIPENNYHKQPVQNVQIIQENEYRRPPVKNVQIIPDNYKYVVVPEKNLPEKNYETYVLRPAKPEQSPKVYKPVYQHVYSSQVTTPQPTYQPTDNPNSLSVILKQLQDSNTLPHTLTADNIDNSIKTLVNILNSLKNTKLQRPIVVDDSDENEEQEEEQEENENDDVSIGDYHLNTPEGGTPGVAGQDYPSYSKIPQTSFNCKTQRYKGFFGDPDTNCQVN